MTVAYLDGLEGRMTWLGVGDVEGVLIRADHRAAPSRERALLRGGVVGFQLPALQGSTIPIVRGDTLILATDGIRSGFSDALSVVPSPQKTADRILSEYGKDTDDALVLAARYIGAHNE
jgi:hypothetical protein